MNQIPNASTWFCVNDVVSVAPLLPCLSDSDFRNEMVFYLFLSVGARAQVSFFLPNFDVIRTKKAEMEPLYIACLGRGKTVLQFLKFFAVIKQ